MEFQRSMTDILASVNRLATLDADIKGSVDPVKTAYGVVRAEYLAKLKALVDAHKAKLDELVASKTSA